MAVSALEGSSNSRAGRHPRMSTTTSAWHGLAVRDEGLGFRAQGFRGLGFRAKVSGVSGAWVKSRCSRVPRVGL